MESIQIEILNNFERDSAWFYKNLQNLREENLTERFVAIFNQKVIASDSSIDILINKIQREGIDPARVFIEFIYPEKYTLLL